MTPGRKLRQAARQVEARQASRVEALENPHRQARCVPWSRLDYV